MSSDNKSSACQHFGACGGCSLQHLEPQAYAAAKRAAVQTALMQAGVNAEVLDTVMVPPRTRRRAVFKIQGSEIGFHAARSHAIIDMRECLVLTPGLFGLVQGLRGRLAALLAAPAELHATETRAGFDLAFRSPENVTPALTARMAKAMQGLPVVRVTFNKSLLLETAAPEIAFGDVCVRPPPQAFLQATREGEAALQDRVLKIVGNAKTVADLFSGLGTFALPLAKKARVHAVEQDGAALTALAAAAKAPKLKPVTTEARDLFKQPLGLAELKAYDAVVLDPPRAGAQAQVQALAKSQVPVIAYAACDAASFARDAALLVAGGYRMAPVTPIDQFLWSSHIELVGAFLAR